jgi:hypothetical protein
MFVPMDTLANFAATNGFPPLSRSGAGDDFFSPGPCNTRSMSYISGAR